jgi:hypothetical protein
VLIVFVLKTYSWSGKCCWLVPAVGWAKLKDWNRPVIPVWYWRQPESVGLKFSIKNFMTILDQIHKKNAIYRDGDEQGICVTLISQLRTVEAVPEKVKATVAVAPVVGPTSM